VVRKDVKRVEQVERVSVVQADSRQLSFRANGGIIADVNPPRLGGPAAERLYDVLRKSKTSIEGRSSCACRMASKGSIEAGEEPTIKPMV
jgi:hypothetical protein